MLTLTKQIPTGYLQRKSIDHSDIWFADKRPKELNRAPLFTRHAQTYQVCPIFIVTDCISGASANENSDYILKSIELYFLCNSNTKYVALACNFTKSKNPQSVFFTPFKLYKLYQIKASHMKM